MGSVSRLCGYLRCVGLSRAKLQLTGRVLVGCQVRIAYGKASSFVNPDLIR